MFIDVSHIVTVYNKEKYLPDTVASLLSQEGGLAREFIFVDDVSTDRSLAVIEDATRGRPDVIIVRNSENKGPSVRLNQGAKLARGQFLHFLDSDDMVPRNGIRVMHKATVDSGADFLYGKWKWTHKPGSELREERIPDDENIRTVLSDDPLETILHGRNRRMCLMARRAVFERAGGADERVFIQDESLPLRLAIHAKRFARISAHVNLIPLTQENLSGNRSQLNHDRFFSYRNALLDYPALPDGKRRLMYGKCVSAAWKETKAAQGLRGHFSGLFLRYLKNAILPAEPDLRALEEMTRFFLTRPGVRRTAAA